MLIEFFMKPQSPSGIAKINTSKDRVVFSKHNK